MEKSLKYNFYNQFGIFELRNIGRQVGVKHPTILKKDDLIKQIILIEEGIIKPHIKTTKQGRPAKNFKQIKVKNFLEVEEDFLKQQIQNFNINNTIILLDNLKNLVFQMYNVIMEYINNQYEYMKEIETHK